MSLSLLQSFLDWISQHSGWSGLIIFLIACSESLALVGLLVPGAVLMFALGTLITTGHLAFWPAVFWAVLGAIAGDGISYWLGYYYRDRLAKLWPLSHHPRLLERGQRFFERHGGKSVLFGRFVGPLRPIVPAIAGMSNMPLPRFFVINILSAIAWAPLYLLPGMAFGLSLTVAGEVAGRLVAAILLLLVSIMLLLWLGRRTYQSLLSRVDRVLFSIANWSRHHPVAGHIPDALIRPDHPEVRVLSLFALSLFLASSLFITFTQLSGHNGLLQQLDKLLLFNLKLLHNPWFNQLMLAISSWADIVNILLFTVISAAWLIWQRNLLALWHLLAALAVPWLLSATLPLLFPAAQTYLPAGPVMLAVAVYGFLAVTLVREFALRYHMLVYLLAATLIFLICFARIYLQFNTLSEVIGGLTLGAIWVASLGIAYRRHVHQAYVRTSALATIGVIYLLCLMLIMPSLSSQHLPRKTEPHATLSLQAWHGEGWQQLPIARSDIRYKRNHPLNLQWAAELTAIRQRLQALGWQVPVSAQGLPLLQWFNPAPVDQALPLLPQVHDGHYDVLRMIRFTAQGPRFIRLWQTPVRIRQGDKTVPLWVGSVGRLYRQRVMGLTLFRTSTDYTSAAIQLREALQVARPQLTIRTETGQLNGQAVQVLLLNNG